MIVRINQFDVSRADDEAGWASFGMLGPIEYPWGDDTNAYELLILEHDEQNQPLPEDFLRTQLRQLIPATVAALREPDEQLVIRLDGPLSQGELLAAMSQITGPDGSGRFAISAVQKLEDEPVESIASIRIQPTPQRLSALCLDPHLGLDRSVRLRAFLVPEEMVNPLLDISTMDDERWAEILPQAGFVLGTVRGLRALHIITRRLQTNVLKARLMHKLAEMTQNTGRGV